MEPVKDCVYTTEQILRELKLPDSPFLRFKINGETSVLQMSHVTDEQLLSVPGIKDRLWQYQRTTHEWIPLFMYVDYRPCTDFMDTEPFSDPEDTAPGLWATPKGFPRQQYL